MEKRFVFICASEAVCATAFLSCALREELLPLAFRDHYPKRSIKFVEAAGWCRLPAELVACDLVSEVGNWLEHSLKTLWQRQNSEAETK